MIDLVHVSEESEMNYFFTDLVVAFLQSFNNSSGKSESTQQSSQLNLMDIRDMIVDWLKLER